MKNLLKKIGNKFATQFSTKSYINQSYLYESNDPTWTSKSYNELSEEGYKKNVIANACISLISRSAAGVDWIVYDSKNQVVENHPILKLLNQPNPVMGGAEFFESLYSHRIISGNAYVLANKLRGELVSEIYLLRPDRTEVIPGKAAIPKGYSYEVDGRKKIYSVDSISGYSDVLHIKNFNPLDDWYGLSNIESAAYSIDLHNQSSIWNQSLLQNGAKPSGALVIKARDGASGYLTKEQFERLQRQLHEKFSGKTNAGRPLLLEGGLEWQEMSYSPKDMDFLEAKNSAARDIALAFGVPPQLLGIKGDNTYSNMQEARFAFWEETIIPMIDKTIDALNTWLSVQLKNHKISYDTNNISALSSRQENLWKRLQLSEFMTVNEKRAAVGLTPIASESAGELRGY